MDQSQPSEDERTQPSYLRRTHNPRGTFSALDSQSTRDDDDDDEEEADDDDDEELPRDSRSETSQQEEGPVAAITSHQRSIFADQSDSDHSSSSSSSSGRRASSSGSSLAAGSGYELGADGLLRLAGSDEAVPYLEAALDRASTLLNVLTPLNFQKDLVMVVSVLPAGLKFTVEESRILQATAFLSAEHFSHFESPILSAVADGNPRAFQFSVLLGPLCECLNIFGSQEQSTLRLVYQGPGMDLFLVVSPSPMIYTNVSLRTIDSEPPTNFQFRNPLTPVRNKLIFRSEALKAAFAELDWSTPDVQVIVSPDEPYFRIATVGPAGSCQVDFARDSPSFEEFESFETQAVVYKLKYLQPAIKALAFAAKTQIRINSEAMMNMMHLITTEDGHTVFIEFFLVAAEE